MAGRRLSADEAALWRLVLSGVRPLPGRALPVVPPPVAGLESKAAKPVRTAPARPVAPTRKTAPATIRPPAAAATLDASWDRRLSRGLVSPDRSIDLHGHGLHGAYTLLDETLERAIAGGERLILLVTGKPPPRESERPHARGAIRAAIGDWLAASRHSDRIAAVRGAHPRHGGSGALYIVLRRTRRIP